MPVELAESRDSTPNRPPTDDPRTDVATAASRDHWFPGYFRRRRSLRWPITLSTLLISLNIVLMVCWIVLLARLESWSGLTIGTIAFAFILVGSSFYLALTIKEVRVNQRQANFVDSVTHELKSPIASLKLYLETLQLRSLDDDQRERFYGVMAAELVRLDELIDHLLEVARLDAIGQQDDPEDVPLPELLESCAQTAARHHGVPFEGVFDFDCPPVTVHARRVVLEMIFRNLLDNAVKYAGDPPRVEVRTAVRKGRVTVEVADNGEGVPDELRRRIFHIFYRGGNELERRRKGTGLGLYIVRTLVHMLRGRVSVSDRPDGPGSLFVVELPARLAS